jgi:NAD dependent epimerase/dehydratase family enzyme
MTIKILVTGGTGLVGNGIQYALNQEKKENKKLEGDTEEWIL